MRVMWLLLLLLLPAIRKHPIDESSLRHTCQDTAAEDQAKAQLRAD